MLLGAYMYVFLQGLDAGAQGLGTGYVHLDIRDMSVPHVVAPLYRHGQSVGEMSPHHDLANLPAVSPSDGCVDLCPCGSHLRFPAGFGGCARFIW